MPGRPERIGLYICLGCCWGLEYPEERIRNFRHQKQCLALSLSCQANSCPLQSRRRRRFSRIFKGFWLATPRSKHATTPRQRRPPFQRISCYLGLSWSAVTPSSRRCCRSMTVPSLCLRGHFIFSKCRSVPGQRQSRLIASSPAIPQRMRRPPSRPAEVDWRPPPSSHKLSGSRQQSSLLPESLGPKRLRRVSFADPVTSSVPPPPRPPPAPPDRAARQRRSTARPARYTA